MLGGGVRVVVGGVVLGGGAEGVGSTLAAVGDEGGESHCG